MFIFAVLGRKAFGANDPVFFGSVPLSGLTLFRVATLASWSPLYQTEYYGCEAFSNGLYSRNNTDGVPYDSLEYFHTRAGQFPHFHCYSPEVSPILSRAYFFMYSVITANVVLSLFISVITVGMFSAIEDIGVMNQRARMRGTTTEGLRSTLHKKLQDPGSYLARLLHDAFGEDLMDLHMPHPKRRVTHGGSSGLNAIQDVAGNVIHDVEAVVGNVYNKVLTDLKAGAGFINIDMGGFARVSRAAKRVVESTPFWYAVVSAILIVGASAALQADNIGDSAMLEMVDLICLVLFTLELLLKLLSYGWHPTEFFLDHWNTFDLVIVVLSYVAILLPDIPGASSVNFVRLLRVFKLAEQVESLKAVFVALIDALQSVSYVICLILLTNYVFGIIGIFMFRHNDPQHWHSIGAAMMAVWQVRGMSTHMMYINSLTHPVWQVETLDGWEDMMYINMYGCDRYGYSDLHGMRTTGENCTHPVAHGWAAAVFFVILVVLGALVLPTVLIGVISIAFDKSNGHITREQSIASAVAAVADVANEWASKSKDDRVVKRLAELGRDGVWLSQHVMLKQRQLFNALDSDGSGELSGTEILPLMEHFCNVYFRSSHVTHDHCLKMFQLIDNGDEQVSFASRGVVAVALAAVCSALTCTPPP